MKSLKLTLIASIISITSFAQIIEKSAKLPVYSYMAYSWSSAKYDLSQKGKMTGIKLFTTSESVATINNVKIYASDAESILSKELVFEGALQVNGKGVVEVIFDHSFSTQSGSVELYFECNDSEGTSSLITFETVSENNASVYNYNEFAQDQTPAYTANEKAKIEFSFNSSLASVKSISNVDCKINRTGEGFQVEGIESGNYMINDMSGRLVKSGAITKSEFISIQNIDKGVYSFSVFNNGNKVHSSLELLK